MGVGDSHMQCFDLTLHLVAGGIVGPPSTDWVVHARYHPPMGHDITWHGEALYECSLQFQN
jgi:hypothetical protein